MSNEIPTLRDPQDRRLPRISPPCGLVIFGITGDLARKKLLPAIYDLANRGLLHPAFSLTGFARRDWSPQDFEEYVRASIEAHTRTGFNEGTWNQLRSGLRFVSGTFDDPEAYRRLADTVAELDSVRGTGGNHAFYLSIPPSYFPVVAKHLSDTGLNKRQGREWRRVIIEKPFGHNLESARELSDVISQIFDEQDVFRIDHYLGKETVQNIMAMRFANAMFEPLWKANYVDSVQITMAEDIGIGTRAGYYDGIGAARDIIQNHLLQLMALTAMEEPVHFTPEEIRAEKEKVLSAVRLPEDLTIDTARGQCAVTSRRTASPPTRRPIPSPRSSSSWTRAAGRAFPSTCAPASASVSVSPRSPSSLSAPPTCPSATRPSASLLRTRSSSASNRMRA